MILDVPLFTQKKGSVDCGHICLQMILSYHGINLSYKEIKSKIETHTIGTYTPQLGLFMHELSFKTKIITMNPSIFALKDQTASQSEIIETLKRIRKATKMKDRKTLTYFLDYLKAGGEVLPRIPDVKTIETEIKNQRPVLALLTSNFLLGVKRDFNFHFNVITGIDKTHIYVNDPLSGPRGGKQKYKISDYLYAIHASAYGDMDNACLMTIRSNK